jgi:hypothetical protein
VAQDFRLKRNAAADKETVTDEETVTEGTFTILL